MKIKPTIIDLFSGCGGLNEGFKKSGFNTLISNDIWEPAFKTFSKNNKDSNFILGDITINKIRREIIKYGKNADILIGGPPCQAYSMAGSRDVDDPRGRLFEDYLKIVNAIKPKYFVMENVKGLLSMEHDKSDLNENQKKELNKIKKLEKKKMGLMLKRKQSKNTSKVLFSSEENDQLESTKEKLKKIKKNTTDLRIKVTETICKKFLKLGYEVKIKVLNAADYGVPQKRERVIIIGAIDGYSIKYPEPYFLENSQKNKMDLFKSNYSKWITVKESIDDLKNVSENHSINHIFTKCGIDFKKKNKKNSNWKISLWRVFRCIF